MNGHVDRRSRASRVAAASLFAVSLATGALAVADSTALRSMPVPDGTPLRTVALDMLRDGRATSIARFESTSSVDDVLDFYRAAWPATGDDPGHLEDGSGDWSIISRMSGDALLTVQLAERSGVVEGILSAASLRQGIGTTAPGGALPPGGRLLSTTETTDGGPYAVTSVIASTARPGEVASFYRDHLVRDGWALAHETVADGTPVLLLTRADGRLDVVVSSLGGGSVAILNEVRGDE